MPVERFTVPYSEEAAADLREGLKRTRWVHGDWEGAASFGVELPALRHGFWRSFATGPMLMPPRSWVERGCNVRRWAEMPRSGHFAAAEEPDLLAGDLRTFFRELR